LVNINYHDWYLPPANLQEGGTILFKPISKSIIKSFIMKKIFTLLSLCLLTLTSYAQEWLSAPISGKQYYIAVGHQKVGYITANENGANLTAKAASKADKSKQTWTCTQNPD
jgi:hypothetical protein